MGKCFVSFEICTVIFVLFSITLTKGVRSDLWALEGDVIKLDFSHPCDIERVTLQYETRVPFYDSVKPESSSLAENQEVMFEYDYRNNYCSLQLKINPVLRSDKGVYVFITYGDNSDGNFQHDSVNLRVNYPPGEASCGWRDENVADDLRLLECTAQSGNMNGEIICYQNEMRMNPVGAPMERDGSLEQAVWVGYSQTIFCCSVLVGHLVDRCKCKDYTWGPHGGIADPCHVAIVTTHQEASTSPQSPTSIPTKEVTQKAKKNHLSNVVLHGIYSCAIGISAMIIIGLCKSLTMYIRKACQVKEITNTTNSQPVRVDIEYMPMETDEH